MAKLMDLSWQAGLLRQSTATSEALVFVVALPAGLCAAQWPDASGRVLTSRTAARQ